MVMATCDSRDLPPALSNCASGYKAYRISATLTIPWVLRPVVARLQEFAPLCRKFHALSTPDSWLAKMYNASLSCIVVVISVGHRSDTVQLVGKEVQRICKLYCSF
jgi:hypothetical protein